MINYRSIALLCCCTAAQALVCTDSYAKSSSQKISAVNIQMAEGGAGKTTPSQILNVLPIHEGEEFEPKKLDEAIDFLRKWGIFETINVNTNAAASGIEINFHLKDAVLIGEIDIVGNYPYIEQKVKKYLTIRVGDMYTRGRVEAQIRKIKDFYEREGFYNTNITVSEKWNEYNKDVDIIFHIKRGTILRYGNIEIAGMKAFPNGRLVSAINPIMRYKPRNLNNAIRETEDFYHKHGYPRTQIEITKRKIDLKRGRIDVSISVSEGPMVKVDFAGNHKLSSRKLKKALTIFEEGSFDDYEIDASKSELLKLYHNNGFDTAEVETSRKINPDGTVLITFKIKEGFKKKIANINFEGNEVFLGRKLKKQMKTKGVSLTSKGVYNKDVLKNDIKNIKKYYESEGYLGAEIGAPSVNEIKEGLEIKIPIAEDGQTIVSEINFLGNNLAPSHTFLKRFKNKIKKPFNPSALESDKQAVIEYYMDHGHPYAEAKQTVETNNNTAAIKYEINEGPLVKIGEILVVGNSLTAVKSIKKAMSIREGEPYSYQKIVDSQLGLRRMGAFNSVTIDAIGFEEREKIVHLKINVEEQKPFVMDFELGYSTDQSLTGSAVFSNLNSFGMAKRSNLTLTGGKKLSRGEANWIDPRFMGSDFEMSTSLWLQYQDKTVYTYVQGGGGFGFFRRYHRTGMLAKYELLRNYFVKGSSTAADSDSLRDNTISKVALSASFDTRNNFSEPTRGIYTIANSDFYNEIKGQHANFVKLRWSLADYFGFFRYFIFTNNFRIGQVETFGKNVSVPSNELFLLGGDDTIRGFSQGALGPVDAAGRPTGGRAEWIYNTELSIKLFGNFRLAGFFDTGSLTNSFSDVTWDTVRRSAGFGMRYVTPVGPMRFDYGIILDRKSGESFGRFHFTFGYVF